MWQKLTALDFRELKDSRIQIENAVRLVSSGPRSYDEKEKGNLHDWLSWDVDASSLKSKRFGSNEGVEFSFDVPRFVLSMVKDALHADHLVLSGMTYPLAFGWIKIKLEKYELDPNLFQDEITYNIEKILGPDEEMNIHYQETFEGISTYYSSTWYLLDQLKPKLQIDGQILIEPATLDMVLIDPDNFQNVKIGLSLGNDEHQGPYFFVKAKDNYQTSDMEVIGHWNSEGWIGAKLLQEDFLCADPELEFAKIMDFMNVNYARLNNN